MPDDELFRLAREDKLFDDAVLDAQVARMLKDAKAKALSSLVALHGFFRDSNALLLKESGELIAQDNELQNMQRTTYSECEDLKKQVASLEVERTNLLGRATTAEK